MTRIAALVPLDGAPADFGVLARMVDTEAPSEPSAGNIASDRLVARERGWFAESTDGNVSLVADSRLDNGGELASRLALGDDHPSDAEIIVASYMRWGERFAEELIGDFAVILIDRARRRVALARDPMAMRPLYFRHEPSRRIIAASTVSALLTVPGVPNEVDERQLATFLHGPYGLAEHTFHRGVSQVAPGATMVISLDGVGVRRSQWRPDPERRIRLPKPADYEEQLRTLLLDAVRSRVGPEGTTAVLLSGGVDSGAVASAIGVLAEGEDVSVPTAYGWGFDELSASDETQPSASLARHHGLPFERLPSDDAYPLVDHPDDGPSLESPAMWPWNSLSLRTFRHIASDGAARLMTGASGDEVIGDAVWDFEGLLRAGRIQAITERVRGVAEQSNTSTLRAGRRLMRTELRRRTATLNPVLGSSLRHLQVDLESERLDDESRLDGRGRQQRHARIFSYSAQQLRSLSQRQMADHGLVHVDPWTDRRLIEWILAIPQYEVTRPDRPKDLVRRSIAPWLPPGHEFVAGGAALAPLRNRGILDRRRNLIDRIVASSELVARGYVDRGWLDDLWAAETSGRPHVQFEWVLAAELWLRRHWTDGRDNV